MTGTARDEGKRAFFEGKSISDCPYAKYSPNWHLWIEGFSWAKAHYGR